MRKKKLMISSLLVSGVILGGLATSGTVLAANGGDYLTHGKVKFTEATSPVDPLDPENPDTDKPVKPVNPVDPTIPIKPVGGPLSIDFASSFDFGVGSLDSKTNVKLYAGAQALGAELPGKGTHPNYVQVTDRRALNSNGAAKGWDLSAKLTKQFSFSSKGNMTGTIEGASILFSNAAVVNEVHNTNVAPKTVAPGFTLELGKSAPTVKASVGEGWGTYTYRFGDATTAASSVELNVPAKSLRTLTPEQDYLAEITWTLAELP